MRAASEADWPETIATVESCIYDVRAGRALAFGLPSGKHFRIAYTYWANGATHNGEYFSATALPQGSLFPLRYNPELPQHNSHGSARSPGRSSLVLVGIAGSVLLFLAWLFFVKSCQ